MGSCGSLAWGSLTSRILLHVNGMQDKLKKLVDMGVDCFKTDFGERIPTDVVYHDGSDPVKMHNYYTQLYNKSVFELLEKRSLAKAKLPFRSFRYSWRTAVPCTLGRRLYSHL